MADMTITRTVKEVHTLKLTRADVFRALCLVFPDVPVDASLLLEIPGGGDWSGQRLGIDDFRNGLEVTWETRMEETTNGETTRA